MRSTWTLLVCCYLIVSTTEGPSRDFYLQNLNSSVKPGVPKTIKTNNPGVLKAARHTAEKFNNCTNDIYLFKESHIKRALVQIVKGLKYILDMEISRTICRKTEHSSLDNCDFQINRTLTQTAAVTSMWYVLSATFSYSLITSYETLYRFMMQDHTWKLRSSNNYIIHGSEHETEHLMGII